MIFIKKLRWYWKLFLEHRRLKKEALDDHIRRAHVAWFDRQMGYPVHTARNPSDSHCATTRDGGEVK